MGLFSRKPKAPEIDMAVSEANKKRLREIFNETVTDGSSFTVFYGYSTTSKFEHGFIFNTNTTTYYEYIIGYRSSDSQIVLVQINWKQNIHSEAFYVDMGKVVDVSYTPKLCQVCLRYEKGYGPYGEILNITDCSSRAIVGVTNLEQGTEREAFLDFLEGFRVKLEREGHSLEKWKR